MKWRAVWRSSGSCCEDLRDETRICRGQATSICPSRYSYTYNSIHPLMPRDQPYASHRSCKSCRPSAGKQLNRRASLPLPSRVSNLSHVVQGQALHCPSFTCTSPAARCHLVTKLWPWRSEEVWGGPYPPAPPLPSLQATMNRGMAGPPVVVPWEHDPE